MLDGELHRNYREQSARNDYDLAIQQSQAQQSQAQQSALVAFGMNATTPPPLDTQTIMQRADEVNTIQRMLNDAQTNAVVLTGDPGAGKSTLAALVYNRLQLAKQSGSQWPHYLVWLGISPYTTVPDMIAAILSAVNMKDPGFFLLKPEQQISTLLRALRRSKENALVVLDQFESLLYPETNQGVAGRGVLSLFLDMLKTDLGTSRIILTSYNSPYDEQNMEETRVRSYLVSRISIPEGTALLQRLGLKGAPEELSLVWQRCAGHVFALILVNAIVQLSARPLNYLLNSPDYQPMWAGDVSLNLISTVYYFLNPIQYTLMRALSLFHEPVPLQGVLITVTGNSAIGSHTNSRPYTALERELGILQRLALVQVAPNAAGVPCYILHPLLRLYITEHYYEGNERRYTEGLTALGVNTGSHPIPNGPQAQQTALAAGHKQAAAYYLHVAREQYPPPEQRKDLHDIEPIIAAIRHLSLSWRWQQACELLFEQGLHENMVQWGAWNTLVGLYTAMLPPLGALQPRDEGLVAGHVGMLYGRMGEYEQSQRYFEQALAIQRKIGDPHGEITTLANQGEILRIRGESKQARANFEQALRLNERVQDVLLQCILLHNLGLLYHSEKNYELAFKCYRESLKLIYSLPDQQYRGMILTNMGMLLYEQKLRREGISILLAALRLRQALQDPTVIQLELFLKALEQKIGADQYGRLCQEAIEMQQQVFARFVTADIR